MAISNQKLRVLHVGRKKLGLDDDAYRDILERATGVRSSRDLDDDSFARVMAWFERLGFKSDFSAANFGASRHWDMASPGQVALIRKLWGEVTDGNGTDAGLDRWIEKIFQVSALRFSTGRDAQRIIGALNRWKQRKAGKPAREAVNA